MTFFRWLIKSTIQTSAGNAVLALVFFCLIGAASAAQSTSWDVTNNPQMYLNASITTTQTASIQLSALIRNGSTVTFPTTSGGVLRIRQGSKVEDISYTSATVNATTRITTLIGVTRNLCWNNASALVSCGNGQQFSKGAIVELSQDARLFNFKTNKDRANTFSASGAVAFTGSGSLGQPTFATTADRDRALGANPAGPVRAACVIATGLCYDYIAGSWTARTGGGVANALETVAGKVQAGTILQQITRTNTGSTAALLFPQLKNLTLTGGAIGYFGRIPLLGTDGKLSTTMYDRGQELFLYPEAGTPIGPSSGFAGGVQYDRGTSGTSTTSTAVTVSFTTGTGANRLLYVGFQHYNAADDVTSVTYNGVAMTRVTFTDEPAGRYTYAYVLLNPDSGAHNVVITRSGTTQEDYVFTSYSGVNQDSNFESFKVGSGTNLAITPTASRANSWIIVHAQTAGGTITAGADTTIRVNGTSQVTADNSGGTGTTVRLSAGTAINGIAIVVSPGSPLVKTFDFDSSTKEYADFRTILPSNYLGGTLTATVYWAAPAGGNGRSVVWEVKGIVLNDGMFLNPAFGTAQTITDSHQTGALLITAPTSALTLTGSSLTAGKPVIIRVSRLPADPSDTMPVDAKLLGIKLSY